MTSPAPIDLRSDTVTRPTPAMREVMAGAEVGDDQFGDDPSINRLQERVAAMLGHEAALWFPTGTMADQVAIRTLTRPGDEVLAAREAHILWHEAGGTSATSGVQINEIGSGSGRFSVEDLLGARKPVAAMYPPSTVVSVENTHNRAGGIVIGVEEGSAIADAARAHGLQTFLDGARLWNAAIALGVAPADLSSPFDVVAVSFSKGLGAPVGAALAGTSRLMDAAWNARKRLGGGLRQPGIIAAGALFGIENHRDRLSIDHANAARFADAVAGTGGARVVPPDTNIVMIDLPASLPAAEAARRAEERGLLVSLWTASRVRVVTHLDASADAVDEASRIMREVLERG